MKPPLISTTSVTVTAVCAAAFLCLAIVTAMTHRPALLTTLCCAFAIGATLLTNAQRRILHDRKARDGGGAPPP